MQCYGIVERIRHIKRQAYWNYSIILMIIMKEDHSMNEVKLKLIVYSEVESED